MITKLPFFFLCYHIYFLLQAFEGVCDSAEQMTEESNISSEIKESDDVDSGKKKDVAYDIKILPNAEKLICCKICSYTTTKDRNWYKHKRSHLGQV